MTRNAPSLLRALASSMRGVELEEQDRALATLAAHYAHRLDQSEDPETLVKVGPLMVNVLRELGMTPTARKALAPTRGGAKPADAPARPLDELRARRDSRTSRAATLDASAP
jgi:hypothetical protein